MGSYSWEKLTFLNEARSAGWEVKYQACDLSPSEHGACLSTWSVGQSSAEEGGKVLWCGLLIPFLTLSCVLRQLGGQCLFPISRYLLKGTWPTTSSSPKCNQNHCVTTSALYLPALDLNPEVKDFLYLLTIPRSHLNALDFLF